MLRKFALIVAAGSALFISAAYALGLGDIDVDSHLNQKFSASIPLNSISQEDADNLLVRLADNDDFNKAGIERADYLSSLNFKVVSDAKNSRIVISSKQIAREPFLSFLLDVRSSTGRVLREYTVLLDPPAYTQPAPASSAAAATPAPAPAKSPSDFYQTAEEANQSKPAPAPKAAAPKPVAAAPVAAAPAADADTDAASAPTSYGPVKAQETFWSIATKLRPNASVTMDQMLWALYSANPQAFEGKGISGLLKGSTLKVPALSTITSVSPAAAKEHLDALKGHRAVASKKSAPVAAAEEAAPAPAPKVEAPVAPKPASKPAVPEKKTVEPVAPAPAAAAPAKPAAPAPAPAPVPAPKAAAPVAPPAPPAPAPAPAAAPEVAPAPAATPEGATPDSASTTPAAVPAEPAPAPPAKPVKKPVSEPTSSAFADDWMAPAIAGVIVLILALLGVRFWQKKQAEKDEPGAPVLTSQASKNLQFWKRAAESAPSVATSTGKFPAVPPPVPPPVSKPAAKSILDVPPPPPKPSTPAWDATVIQPAAAASPGFDLTQTMDRPSEPNPFGETGGVDEFNTTNQFDTDTVKVNANAEANDPVSEADFHLAYGLYDEAALLLESAVEKNPNRTDLRVKLAETYFRANKPHEFDDVAQSLKPQLDSNEWQKIAIMGNQLLPDSPLYKGSAGAALEDSVDLAFDEPIDLGAAETQIFSTTATSMPAQSAPSARSSSSVLDFKLEDLEAPQVAKPSPAPAAAPAKAADSNTLEFSLSDFDLSAPGAKPAEAPAAAPVETAAAPAPAKASNAVEFDLGGFDLEPAKNAGAAPEEDINLDDFDLGELADDSHAISAGDEAGTKLDLARAYVDMGDNDMARSLLTEVLVQGSEEQKTEAQALIQRLA